MYTDEKSLLYKCKTTVEDSLTFVGVKKLKRKYIDFVLSIFYLLLRPL